MTGVEQGLHYIERELHYMVKDQLGNGANIKYVDKIIEDCCGIPHFCTSVVTSKRPLAAILKAVRGPRGVILVRFFNVSLHDTRIDMVMVLAEASKLCNHKNKSARKANAYLMKLYRKSAKKMSRLITVSQGKDEDSYKALYRSLSNFAGITDYDYDDEDDDDFDDVDMHEFGDSEFADACLNAYREGKEPPTFKDLGLGSIADAKDGDAALRKIAEIEAKIGRHLTDAELDRLICGDDDDDDEEDDDDEDRTAEMVEGLATQIFAKVMQKMNEVMGPTMVTKTPKVTTTMDIAEEVEKLRAYNESITHPSSGSSPVRADMSHKPVKLSEAYKLPKPTEIPSDTSTETLIGMRNHMHDETPSTTSNEESAEESNSLPPIDEMGGAVVDMTASPEVATEVNETPNMEPATEAVSDIVSRFMNAQNILEFLGSDDDDDEDEEDESDDEEDETEDSDDEEDETSEKVVDSASLVEGSVSREDDHGLILDTILSDYSIFESDHTKAYINRFKNYLTVTGIDVYDVFVALVPSDDPKKLLTLITTIRIKGDFEIINNMNISTIMYKHVMELAQKLGISEDMIDTEFNMVDSIETLDHEMTNLEDYHVKRIWVKGTTEFYSALCAIVAYTYQRTGKLINIAFADYPRVKKAELFFVDKNYEGEGPDTELQKFYDDELVDEGIMDEVFKYFHNRNEITCHIGNEKLFETLKGIFADENLNIDGFLDIYADRTLDYMERYFYLRDIPAKFNYKAIVSFGQRNMIFDMIFDVITKRELTTEEKKELEENLALNCDYQVGPENVLRAISMNLEVAPYVTYRVDTDDDESTEETPTEEKDDSSKTSNFGI